MNERTITTLHEINRRFYQETALEFSQTRQSPWPGWDRVVRSVAPSLSDLNPRILDVGCGNGRFFQFLRSRLGGAFSYVGMDDSPQLLADAKAAAERQETSLARGEATVIASGPSTPASELSAAEEKPRAGPVTVTWLRHDVLRNPQPEEVVRGRFNWIALFGVLHHIPSLERRQNVLLQWSRLLEHGGFLTVSFWGFLLAHRLRRKTVSWQRWTDISGEVVDEEQLEEGDCLLTFGKNQGLRYCHFSDAREQEQLVQQLVRLLPLDLVDEFAADGKEGNLNHYYLLRRTDPAATETLA